MNPLAGVTPLASPIETLRGLLCGEVRSVELEALPVALLHLPLSRKIDIEFQISIDSILDKAIDCEFRRADEAGAQGIRYGSEIPVRITARFGVAVSFPGIWLGTCGKSDPAFPPSHQATKPPSRQNFRLTFVNRANLTRRAKA